MQQDPAGGGQVGGKGVDICNTLKNKEFLKIKKIKVHVSKLIFKCEITNSCKLANEPMFCKHG